MPDRIPSLAATALTIALALASPTAALAQVGAEESAGKMKPAEGLESTLWASEPMVINPTTIDVDSRGRVWVTEGLNYRTTHHKVERIPDADKIKILSDTDGDGKADRMIVFADKIWPIPMGIAVEEHYGKDGKYQGAKVYVGNSPDLLVLEDTDGDDVADKRYPILTGFGGIDSDHGVHGTAFGPDGKLYFTHGDGCCSYEQDHSHRERNFNVTDATGRHVWSDQLANTLRVDRDGKNFEILADRQRNNYETASNSFGNQFTSDNDDDGNRGCRVIWVMDGGKYGYRTPGSPRHWGEDVPGNVPKLVGTGNGSPCGLMVYEGDLFPKEFQGAVLEAEAGPRVINYFPIVRKGAAFRTQHKVMLSSDDPWFRPVDVAAAPDGSLFVADWYDGGVGGHAFRDQTTGRIYRLAPKGAAWKKVDYDFATVPGLIEALKSPVVATRDAARRGLIERTEAPIDGGINNRNEAENALTKLANSDDRPEFRARAFWALASTKGNSIRMIRARVNVMPDPRLRELFVRIIGRDLTTNGHVEDGGAAAAAHLEALQYRPLAQAVYDPDPGVRRELILALRDLPTNYNEPGATRGVPPGVTATHPPVRALLGKLAASWDGQDRWYLEALGLALRDREPEYVKSLFDGKLYGDLDLDNAGEASNVALPPYFPVDRNEAYISISDPEPPPASPLSKTLGLMWELHRPECLPLLAEILPKLKSPELQAAADSVVLQMEDASAAVALAEMAASIKDPIRVRQILATLGRKLNGPWRDAAKDPKVVGAIEAAIKDPATRTQGIETAAATGDVRYAPDLLNFVADPKVPDEARVAAIEAVARLKGGEASKTIRELIDGAKGSKTASPTAEAAVRSLPRIGGDAGKELSAIVLSEDYPLGLRREALRGVGQLGDGGQRILAMARDGKLPESLRTEASTILGSHRDRNIRSEAEKVIPRPKTKSGRPIPAIFDLVRRDGDAERGRAIFHARVENACNACHRVQGQGNWIGPDLSTIGAKYGKDELYRSILNPSAAIGYNYRSTQVALADGRVVTGLVVEDTPDRLVLKSADGRKVALRPSEIEARQTSDVSLMPEGLAEALDEQQFVDLVTFLSTLKKPVSIVGQAQATIAGAEAAGRPISANAEGIIDLVPLIGTEPGKAATIRTPVTSPVDQEARLVLDTKAEVKATLGGKPVELSGSKEGEPRVATVKLPKGSTELLLTIPGGPDASIVATIVSDRPIEFSPGEARKP